VECYDLVFQVLDELDAKFGQGPEMLDGMPTPATRLRNETWQLVYSSGDEVFHNTLYEWLYTRGLSDRLLEVDSPHVLGYLQRRSLESIDHCELLWQYHARRENFLAAAEVLHKLAQSEFDIPLEKRLEFLSRAKGFCGSFGPMGMRQKMNELSHTLQEELDVAVIQDDILRRIKEDDRISPAKKEKLIKELDSNLLTLSDVCGSLLFC
jgi:nuclear pore complex protein Nup155